MAHKFNKSTALFGSEDTGLKKEKDLNKGAIKGLLLAFLGGKMDINILEQRLIELNPYGPEEIEYDWYNDWIHENIGEYKSGETYVLEIESSGGIYQSLFN